VLVVDVREYPEYAGGRVPGAKLVPLGHLAARSAELDRGKPVYVICRTGRRSAEAQRVLGALGFENVVDVAGGMTAWRKAGFPVERDARAPWALDRQVRLAAGALVLAGVLLGAFVAAPFVWLAAFVGAGLAFSAVTDTCAMGEVLARMPWNRPLEEYAQACRPGRPSNASKRAEGTCISSSASYSAPL
jgi:rhodanese-related sulfurtransferase